jgi:hypothetical protein
MCGDRVQPNTKSFTPNAFFKDGMHYCFNVIGGYTIAAISFLIGCEDWICEKHCNNQYMSLLPIP